MAATQQLAEEGLLPREDSDAPFQRQLSAVCNFLIALLAGFVSDAMACVM